MRVRFAAMFIALCFVRLAVAQDETPTKVTDQNRSGDLPFSTSIGTQIEHVDVASAALNITIPFHKIPGRGIDMDLGFRWSSNGFVLAPRTDGLGRPFWVWNFDVNSGWRTFGTSHTSAYSRIQCDYPLGWMNVWTNHIYTDRMGEKHPVAIQNENGGCASPGNPTNPDLTAQGMLGKTSGVNGQTSIITNADGSIEDYKDSNGNSISGGLDTLGRTDFTVQTTTGGNGYTTQQIYTYTDSNGTAQTFTVNWQLISVTTNWGGSCGYGSVTQLVGAQRNVVTSIVLPNQKQYIFDYTDPYGEITGIHLPTGGVITYTWANLSNCRQTRRYVASRTETVNGVQSTWNFSMSVVSGPTTVQDIVSYPPVGSPAVQNQSVFVSYQGAITDAKIYAGSVQGTPLREYKIVYASDNNPYADELCYNDLFPPPDTENLPIAQRPTSITTILEDGSRQKQTQFDYETFTYNYYPSHCSSLGINNQQFTYTTSRGNVTEIREYDWGQGAHGALIRRIDKTYLHNSNSTYLTYNIVGQVLQNTIWDASSHQVAQTQYEYDNYVAGQNALVSTSGSPAPQHDYTNFSSTFIYRGNATRVKRWRDTDGHLLTTTYTYDDLGNIRAIADPLTHTTTFGYTDAWSGSSCPPVGNSYAYVTSVTNALNQQIQRTFYQCTGLLQAHKDQNDINAGRTGTLYSYDLLGRTTVAQATHLTGDSSWGQTAYAYNDVPPVSVTTTTKVTSTVNLISLAISDGLGRVTQGQLTSDPDGVTYTDTAYDSLGRTLTASNPHRSTSSTTDGTSTYTYDPLSRVTKITQPDGSTSLTTFSLNCTTVTDEAGKSRKSCSDGIGRLFQVFEDPTGLNYETDYQYDVLGNLTRVDQKGGTTDPTQWRTRIFSYNSLSQLLTSNNPEPGNIAYAYDDAGNVLSKTSAAPNQPNSGVTQTIYFCYDSLNRVTSKWYAATTCSGSSTVANYLYDQTSYNGLTIANGVGRRTGMNDGSGQVAWNFDGLGHALNEKRTIGTITKTTSYAYNLDGSISSITYPSGRVLNYSYVSGANTAGRPLQVVDPNGPINYLTGATYTPNGALKSLSNGSSVSGALTYNSRLQPLQMYYTTGTISSQTLTQLQQSACPTTVAAIMSRSYNFGAGTNDNGNPQVITNCRDTNRTQNFTYDSLNRITSGYTSGPNWGEDFTIDPWSNLTNRNPHAGKTNYEPLNAPANTKNQLTGFGYDAPGNMTLNGTITYTYDAENRLASTSGATYTYDGDGDRVKKVSGSTTTLYWFGSSEHVLTETDGSGSLNSDYIFFGGKRIARRDANGDKRYYFSDHLGSASVVTGPTGAIQSESDYYPYGGEIVITAGSGIPNRYKFTGKERDAESGLDNFGARYYTSSLGRFMTPDWSARATTIPYALFGEPQSLNLYGYVRNDPVSRVDADGHGRVDIYGDFGGGSGLFDVFFNAQTAAQASADCGSTSGGCGVPQVAAAQQPQQPISSVSILGRTIPVTYTTDVSDAARLAASSAITAAANAVNSNADKLTASEKNAIDQVRSISITGSKEYLGAKKGGMRLSADYVSDISAAWLGSLLGHEGQHFLNKGHYGGKDLWKDEQNAGQVQLGIGNKIGFTERETQYLQDYIDDKNKDALQKHMKGLKYGHQ